MVLRDRRVELAILETARGGILRRGLATSRADVALVTNIAEDHFGDFGVTTLDELADVKLVVARVVAPSGTVVLNADDPILRARGPALGRYVAWFSLDPAHPLLDRPVLACTVERGAVVVHAGGTTQAVADLADIPITRSGAVPYNVSNVLGATLAAVVLGFAPDRIGAALRHFTGSADENPGRGNLLDIGGVRVIVDYAHNPHGLAALGQLADSLPASRRLLLLGQAGDRHDDALRDLARAAWKLRPDRVVLKELAGLRRGRAAGEVRAVLADELRRLGAGPGTIDEVQSDVDAVEAALRWARPGDLLILLIHEQREEVLRMLAEARAARA
jgi:UDP-N-acetylmuramyl tripeptide synthase